MDAHTQPVTTCRKLALHIVASLAAVDLIPAGGDDMLSAVERIESAIRAALHDPYSPIAGELKEFATGRGRWEDV